MIHIRRQTFQYQSYLDSTLLSKALRRQAMNEPIVSPQREQIVGKTIALHPSSATPIAVRPVSGRAAQGAGAVILTPGSVWRPSDKGFDAIEWGLPFGWLGGGVAQILVADSERDSFDWVAQATEVLFHRVRVLASADNNTLDTVANYPYTFPWANAAAVSSGVTLPQSGPPMLAVRPSRTFLIARTTALTAPAAARLLWSAADADDSGTVKYLDVQFPAQIATTTGNPIIAIMDEILPLGGDNCILTIKDLTGTAALTGVYIDVLRYGVI